MQCKGEIGRIVRCQSIPTPDLQQVVNAVTAGNKEEAAANAKKTGQQP